MPTLQVRPSDLDRYKLPAQCRLQLTEHDRKMGEELLQEAFVQRHPEWVKELQLMLKSGEKAEIQVQITAMLNIYPTLIHFYEDPLIDLNCYCTIINNQRALSISVVGSQLFWIPIYHRAVSAAEASRRGLDLIQSQLI